MGYTKMPVHTHTEIMTFDEVIDEAKSILANIVREANGKPLDALALAIASLIQADNMVGLAVARIGTEGFGTYWASQVRAAGGGVQVAEA